MKSYGWPKTTERVEVDKYKILLQMTYHIGFPIPSGLGHIYMYIQAMINGLSDCML